MSEWALLARRGRTRCCGLVHRQCDCSCRHGSCAFSGADTGVAAVSHTRTHTHSRVYKNMPIMLLCLDNVAEMKRPQRHTSLRPRRDAGSLSRLKTQASRAWCSRTTGRWKAGQRFRWAAVAWSSRCESFNFRNVGQGSDTDKRKRRREETHGQAEASRVLSFEPTPVVAPASVVELGGADQRDSPRGRATGRDWPASVLS